ncbi:MAG: universal stress protein [Deltaproteobacteria bacterium]
MKLRRILFCTDFSENSFGARDWAIEYAQAFMARVDVLHVIGPSLSCPLYEKRLTVDREQLYQEIEAGVQRELHCVAEVFKPKLGAVEAKLRIGEPYEEIVRYADENSIDLIVMGTHGWTGAKPHSVGSTAERVVRNANCPVVVVKAGLPGNV